jgi:hypothetical protein
MSVPTASSDSATPWFKRPMYLALIIGGVIVVLVGSALGIYFGIYANKADDGKEGEKPADEATIKAALDEFKPYEKLYKDADKLDLSNIPEAQKALDAIKKFNDVKGASAKLDLTDKDVKARYEALAKLSKDPNVDLAKIKSIMDEGNALPDATPIDKDKHDVIETYKAIIPKAQAWLTKHPARPKPATKVKVALAGFNVFTDFVDTAACVDDQNCPLSEQAADQIKAAAAAPSDKGIQDAVDKAKETIAVNVFKKVQPVLVKVKTALAGPATTKATADALVLELQPLSGHQLAAAYADKLIKDLNALHSPQGTYDKCKKTAVDAFLTAVNPAAGAAAAPAVTAAKTKLVTDLKACVDGKPPAGVIEQDPFNLTGMTLDPAAEAASLASLALIVKNYAKHEYTKDLETKLPAAADKPTTLQAVANKIENVYRAFDAAATFTVQNLRDFLTFSFFDRIKDQTSVAGAVQYAESVVKHLWPELVNNITDFKKVAAAYGAALETLGRAIQARNIFSVNAQENISAGKTYEPFLKAFNLKVVLQKLIMEPPATITTNKAIKVAQGLKDAVKAAYEALGVGIKAVAHAKSKAAVADNLEIAGGVRKFRALTDLPAGTPAPETAAWTALKTAILAKLTATAGLAANAPPTLQQFNDAVNAACDEHLQPLRDALGVAYNNAIGMVYEEIAAPVAPPKDSVGLAGQLDGIFPAGSPGKAAWDAFKGDPTKVHFDTLLPLVQAKSAADLKIFKDYVQALHDEAAAGPVKPALQAMIPLIVAKAAADSKAPFTSVPTINASPKWAAFNKADPSATECLDFLTFIWADYPATLLDDLETLAKEKSAALPVAANKTALNNMINSIVAAKPLANNVAITGHAAWKGFKPPFDAAKCNALMAHVNTIPAQKGNMHNLATELVKQTAAGPEKTALEALRDGVMPAAKPVPAFDDAVAALIAAVPAAKKGAQEDLVKSYAAAAAPKPVLTADSLKLLLESYKEAPWTAAKLTNNSEEIDEILSVLSASPAEIEVLRAYLAANTTNITMAGVGNFSIDTSANAAAEATKKKIEKYLKKMASSKTLKTYTTYLTASDDKGCLTPDGILKIGRQLIHELFK